MISCAVCPAPRERDSTPLLATKESFPRKRESHCAGRSTLATRSVPPDHVSVIGISRALLTTHQPLSKKLECRLVTYLAQTTGFDLVDKAAYAVFVRDERAEPYAADRLAHVLLQVGEGFHGEMGLQAYLFVDLGFELVVGERQHAAIGVVDQDDLAGAEEALGDRKRPDLVVRYHATRVPDHVRVAFLEPEHPVDVEPGIHAGDYGHALGRGQREVSLVEGLGISLVVPRQLVGYAHQLLLSFLLQASGSTREPVGTGVCPGQTMKSACIAHRHPSGPRHLTTL